MNICIIGWGLVDEMESTPEYLHMKTLTDFGHNVDFFCVTEHGISNYKNTKINRVKQFDEKLLSYKPDVMHVHHCENPLSFKACKYAKKNNIPVVMNIHSIVNSVEKYIPYVDKFVVFSNKEYLFRKEIDENKKTIIPNGIEVNRYKSNGNKFKKDKINILFVGQLFEWKGIFDIVEVAKGLIDKGIKNFKFNIVSHVIGEYNKLRDCIINNDMLEYIDIYPSKHSERKFTDLLDIYGSCDIFYLPTHMDTFPTTLLEAMASEKPCVATTVGGIPNIINHEETGFHIRENNLLKESVDRLSDLIKDEEKRIFFGKRGLNKVLSNYDIKDIIRRYIKLYELLQ